MSEHCDGKLVSLGVIWSIIGYAYKTANSSIYGEGLFLSDSWKLELLVLGMKLVRQWSKEGTFITSSL
jgi:hypothetical protein